MPIDYGALTSDATIQALKLSVDASAMRHRAIASNLANINTPNYQRQDVSGAFQVEFDRAMQQLRDGQSVGRLPEASVEVAGGEGMTRYDGNNVNLDQELVAMTQNQSEFDFATKMLMQRYREMRGAITGRF